MEVSRDHFGVRLKHCKGETHLCPSYKARREALRLLGFKDGKRYATEKEAEAIASEWRNKGYDMETFRGFMLSF